jgi:putative transposase
MNNLKTRKQIRLRNYDYSEDGYYFVSVCSSKRQNIFTDVGASLASARKNGFELSSVGRIIEQQWQNIPNLYDNIELDEYIIMPNHIHGIIHINRQKRSDARPAPTISDIICSFKSRSSVEYIRYAKHNNLNFCGKIWQRSFYDHVIRNERSLNAIREYMLANPVNWELDIENLLNL